MMKKRIALLLTCALLLALTACTGTGGTSSTPAPSPAQSGSNTSDETAKYPDKELRIQVPFKTGGALDVQARTTAQYLAKELGVNVIVENTVGAGGQLGTTEYLKEKPNTSTILLTDAWLLTVTPLLGPVDYSIEDFVPIIDHNITNFCLYANPSKSGISSFEDLQEYGKSQRILFGSGGVGTSLHIVQKSMLDMMNVTSDAITQNSTAEGLANLMAGTVDISMSSFKDAADYVKNGEIVPILWFGEGTYSEGEAYAAGVPAAGDKGLDIIYKGFYYYSIRKGTDQAIVDKLYDALSKVYANPEFIADCETLGFAPSGMSADGIDSYLTTFADMAKNTFTLK